MASRVKIVDGRAGAALLEACLDARGARHDRTVFEGDDEREQPLCSGVRVVAVRASDDHRPVGRCSRCASSSSTLTPTTSCVSWSDTSNENECSGSTPQAPRSTQHETIRTPPPYRCPSNVATRMTRPAIVPPPAMPDVERGATSRRAVPRAMNGPPYVRRASTSCCLSGVSLSPSRDLSTRPWIPGWDGGCRSGVRVVAQERGRAVCRQAPG
jgi:hypothetical protein